MYVAVKGGETAIRNAHRLLDDRRRGDVRCQHFASTRLPSSLRWR
jgi:alpha-D-ribose 1-methylphosphonate 5-triphosphate synthase subunit PhnI